MTTDSTSKTAKIKVLYIDDEVNNLNVFKAAFRREYDITLCGSALEAYEILKTQEFEVIITDQRMPEINGTDFLASILKTHPEPISLRKENKLLTHSLLLANEQLEFMLRQKLLS